MDQPFATTITLEHSTISFRHRPLGRCASPPIWGCYELDNDEAESDNESRSDSEEEEPITIIITQVDPASIPLPPSVPSSPVQQVSDILSDDTAPRPTTDEPLDIIINDSTMSAPTSLQQSLTDVAPPSTGDDSRKDAGLLGHAPQQSKLIQSIQTQLTDVNLITTDHTEEEDFGIAALLEHQVHETATATVTVPDITAGAEIDATANLHADATRIIRSDSNLIKVDEDKVLDQQPGHERQRGEELVEEPTQEPIVVEELIAEKQPVQESIQIDQESTSMEGQSTDRGEDALTPSPPDEGCNTDCRPISKLDKGKGREILRDSSILSELQDSTQGGQITLDTTADPVLLDVNATSSSNGEPTPTLCTPPTPSSRVSRRGRGGGRSGEAREKRMPKYQPILTIRSSQGWIWNQDLFVPHYMKDRYITYPPDPSYGRPNTLHSSTPGGQDPPGVEYDCVAIALTAEDMEMVLPP